MFKRITFILGVLCLVLSCYLFYSEINYTKDLQNSIDIELQSHIVELTPVPKSNNNSSNKVKTKKTYKNILKIPDLKLLVPILPDTSKESLRKGAGHYSGTAGLGENGNCVLAGHSSSVYNCVFDPLHNIKLGTKVYVFDDDCNKYKYIVKDIKSSADPYDLSVLDSKDNDKGYLTLITCTDYGKKRFVVVCEMEDINEKDKK